MRCHVCGAPLGHAPVGASQCAYCGSAVLVPQHPAEPQPPLPTLPPSPFWRRLKAVSAPLLGAGAGFLAVHFFDLFRHNIGSAEQTVGAAVLIGVISIGLALGGRKLAAATASAWAGGFLVAKPLLRPVYWEEGDFFSLDSETHLNFLVPGGALLVLASLFALALGRRGGSSLSPVSNIVTAIGLVIGVAAGAQVYSAETNDEVLARFRPRFQAMRVRLKEIHAALPGKGKGPGSRKLEPAPAFSERRWSNAEIVSAEELLSPEAGARERLAPSGYLMLGLRWTGSNNPMAPYIRARRAGGTAERLEDALQTRYLAVYRTGEVLEVFVIDLQGAAPGRIAASGETQQWSSYSANVSALARLLEETSGGSFDLGH